MLLQSNLNPDYLLDCADNLVINSLLESISKRIQTNWEMARFTAYYSVLPYLKEGFKISDLVQFPWEKSETEDNNFESVEELQAYQQQLMNQYF